MRVLLGAALIGIRDNGEAPCGNHQNSKVLSCHLQILFKNLQDENWEIDEQIMTDDVAKGIMVIHEDFKIYLGQEAHFGESNGKIKTNDDL